MTYLCKVISNPKYTAMIFFVIGLAIAILAGYIIIGLIQLVFGILGAILSFFFDR